MRRWFYKVYNWTPDEVDRIPIEELIWLPIIEGADAEAHDYKIRQAQKSSAPVKNKRPLQGF